MDQNESYTYPVGLIDTQDLGAGVYVFRDDADLRGFILDDLLSIYEDDLNDEERAEAQAEMERLRGLGIRALVQEYVDSTDTILIDVHEKDEVLVEDVLASLPDGDRSHDMPGD